MKRILFSTAAALAIVLPSLANAGVVTAPVDVSGTWTGSASCKALDADGITKISVSYEFPQVRMAMAGSSFVAAEFDGTTVTPGGLCGVVNGANGRGVGTLMASDAVGGMVVFDMDAPMASIYLKSVKVDPTTGKGSIQGTGTLVPYVDGVIGTCKIKLTRTSDAIPTLDSGLLSVCGV